MEKDEGVVWSKIEQANDKLPTRRSGHSLSALGTQAALFGGISLTNPPAPNNELYTCDMIPKGEW
jgi:hypothetical protein